MHSMLRAHRMMLTAGALLLAPDAARAQQTPDEAVPSVAAVRSASGAILVTARHYVPDAAITANKADIPLIRTPQSISVVTRDQIDLLNFIDAQQAVRYVAGVFGESYGPDPRYDFVTVRGFTPRQYIDGLAVPATTTIASTGVDLYAFQSLDILKGPSSALYGLAPPGGILNETSRRPSPAFDGEIEAKLGNHRFGEIASTVTGPVAPMLDVRFTGLVRDTDGEVDDTHSQRVLAAPSATLKLGPDTRLTGLAYYQYDEVDGGAGGFLPIAGTRDPNPNGQIARSANLDSPYDRFFRRQYGIGYDFEHRFSDALAFHANAKWSRYSEETPVGLYSGGGFVNATDPSRADYLRILQQYDFTYAETVRSFASDNRFDAVFRTGPLRHQLLLGIDYRSVANRARYGFALAGLLDPFAPAYAPAPVLGYPLAYNDEHLRQTGLYGQDQIGLGRLYLTLGGRYDRVAIGAHLQGTEQRERKFTYRLGLTYVSPAGIAPYLSYATSFEPVLGTDAVTGKAFVPSAVHQWEGGIKIDGRGLPPGIKLFATIAGFDIRETNFVSPQVAITPIASVQGGVVEVYGAELEAVARIYDRLSINAAYSYNHSAVLKSPAEPQDVGYPMPATPEHKASVLVDYTLSQGPLAGLGLGLGVRHTSAVTGGLPGAFAAAVYRADAATLADAALHYDLPGWRIALNASNLLDTRYVARCASAFGCVYGAGRQVIATLTKRFR